MSITTTVKETENYAYFHDRMMGVGWFYRKSDDSLTLLDTGIAAVYNKDTLVNYSDDAFDKIAEEQCYSPAEMEQE